MDRTDWRNAFGLFLLSLVAYVASSGHMLWRQSRAPHFAYQADAFLRGQLSLALPPPNLNDWVLSNGRWYVSFPPFPAVLMAPFVAVWGFTFNEVLFTLVFGALNVPLLYALLRRLAASGEEGADGGRPAAEHVAHALVFGFGTLAWYCAIRGEVWFTAHTIGVTLTLLYLHAAHRARRPLLAGIALACAAATRTPLTFAAVFFVLEALGGSGRLGPTFRARLRDPACPRDAFRRVALFVLPLVLVGAAVAWMNAARFGNPLEFGHRLLYDNQANARIEEYGLFHYHFLARNLHDALARLPEVRLHPLRIGFSGEGMSVFVTTPLFVLLLRPRQWSRLHAPLWITTAAVAVPGFLYQNSGWYQFGYRFSLDYTAYLLLLLSLGRNPLTRVWWVLAVAGVAMNGWGAAVFNRTG
jgi:hypothetical protein